MKERTYPFEWHVEWLLFEVLFLLRKNATGNSNKKTNRIPFNIWRVLDFWLFCHTKNEFLKTSTAKRKSINWGWCRFSRFKFTPTSSLVFWSKPRHNEIIFNTNNQNQLTWTFWMRHEFGVILTLPQLTKEGVSKFHLERNFPISLEHEVNKDFVLLSEPWLLQCGQSDVETSPRKQERKKCSKNVLSDSLYFPLARPEILARERSVFFLCAELHSDWANDNNTSKASSYRFIWINWIHWSSGCGLKNCSNSSQYSLLCSNSFLFFPVE